MFFKYKILYYIGIILAILLFVAIFYIKKKKSGYEDGKKTLGYAFIKDNDYYRKKVNIYRYGSLALLLSFIVSIFSCFMLMARPVNTERIDKERYNRDIFLCIDASASVSTLNQKLVYELQETVRKMDGERVGIVIFNTAPVLYVPLTDDYEFVIEQLQELQKCFNGMDDSGYVTYGWLEKYGYIYNGTIVGSESRGSSLIGDGLATTVYDFSELENDKDRTRIIIFSTDNELAGEPVVSLDEAADICVKHDVVVYGIGTRSMSDDNMEEMKQAVEKTGGVFYLEENASTFSKIVENINRSSQSLVIDGAEYKEVADINGVFAALLITICISYGLCFYLKKWV